MYKKQIFWQNGTPVNQILTIFLKISNKNDNKSTGKNNIYIYIYI